MEINSIEELLLDNNQINVRKLGRLITLIENDSKRAEKILSKIYKENKECLVMGITGPPGAGKSSLTDGIITKYRSRGKKVAVIAIDPSSPFSGGAILGDRIRMSSHSSDSNVFIRSMGTRGSLGGLASATVDVMNLLKSVGFDVIIIETVGVGQSEVDVMNIADVVLLVLVPGLGDDIQALKAGIMEIADIFVINKSDKDGKERLLAEINMIIHLNKDKLDWIPPIVETIAIENKGLDELINLADKRLDFVVKNYKSVKNAKLFNQFSHMVEEKIGGNILAILKNEGIFKEWINDVVEENANPYSKMVEFEQKLKIKWEK